MDVKADLAEMIIANYHGVDAARIARDEFNRVFRQKETPAEMETREMERGAGPIRVSKLIASLGLAPSVAEAQRLIESGAVHLNDQRVSNVKAEIDLSQPAEYTFKVGKRRFLRLVVRV
jgi:tyrosyl-tRNA synthetase